MGKNICKIRKKSGNELLLKIYKMHLEFNGNKKPSYNKDQKLEHTKT